MSNLWVFEYRVPVYQSITTGSRPLDVKFVRPYIYKHGSPAGSLRIDIRDTNDKIVASSQSRTISNLFPNYTYEHGRKYFEISVGLAANTTYRVTLVATDYSFSESAYVGFCNGFEVGNDLESYSAKNGPQAALHFELWTNQRYNRSTE